MQRRLSQRWLISVLTLACWVSWTAQAVSGPDATVLRARLTLSQDDGRADLSEIERASAPELYFRVTLDHVPQGQRLQLSGEWVDPAGHVARTNRWQTRVVDHLPWTTFCRCRLDPGDPPGTWQVHMALGGRRIASKKFTVR